MHVTIKGTKLTITVDLAEKGTPSSTGKMLHYFLAPWTDLGVRHNDQPLRAMVQIGCKNPDYTAA